MRNGGPIKGRGNRRLPSTAADAAGGGRGRNCVVGADGETDRSAEDRVSGVRIRAALAAGWELPAAGDRVRGTMAKGASRLFRRRNGGLKPTLLLVDNDAADAFAFAHQVEAVVDFLERQHVRDQIVDVDPLVHVPVDDAGDVGAA